MAIGDTVRELLIRLGLTGQAETKAGLDEVTASAEKLGTTTTEAATASGTASVAQANALKDLEGALARASAQSLNFGEASKVGGKVAADEYLFLQNSVGALEAAIAKARATGAVIPPETLTALQGFRTQLLAAQAPVEEHAKGMGRVRDSHVGAKVAMDVSREAMGPVARAFYALTESGNAVVATFGKLALGVGSAVGGLFILGKAFTELSARGVDVTTMGDRMSGIWDAIAQALGGTSAATAAATAAMVSSEAKMRDLDAAQRSYSTGLDLLAGLNLDAAKATKVFDSALGEINVAVTGFEGQATNAVGAINTINQAFNSVAILAPQRAAAYRAEFATLVTAAQSGTKESITALQQFQTTIIGVGNEADKQFTKVAEAEGKTGAGAKEFAKDAGQIAGTAVNAAAGLDRLTGAGLTEAQAFEKLKGPIEAVLAFYMRYPATLADLDKAQRAVVLRLLEEAKGHDAVSLALKQSALDSEKARKEYDGLAESIVKAGAASGNYKAAAAAEHAQLDSDISALEKKKNTLGGLTVAEQSYLNNLLAIHAALTPLTVEEEKHNKAQEEGVKKAHDLSKSYEDLTKAREKDKLEIEKHRVTFIASLDAELAKAIASGNAQVAALDAQHKAMEIDDHEYNQSVNQMFADMAAAKRAAVEAEDKANQEAIAKEKEHQRVYEETAGAMIKAYEQATGTVAASLVVLKEKQAEYDAAAATSLAKVRGEWDETSQKVRDHATEYSKITIAWGEAQHSITSGVAIVDTSLVGLLGRLKEIKTGLDLLKGAADIAFGGSGGGAPEQFGPPAPAPTGEVPPEQLGI